MTDDDKALVERLREQVKLTTWPDAQIYMEQSSHRIEALSLENQELRSEIARLREAGAKLNNHACHDDDCQIVTHGIWSDPIPCTCGYEDAWKLWSAALGDGE